MGESTHISNLQTELKYLDSFKCYNILTDLGGYPPWGYMGLMDGGVGGCGYMECPMQAHMCKISHFKIFERVNLGVSTAWNCVIANMVEDNVEICSSI